MATDRTFVALGDSFTEGLHDDLGPDGRHLGWADRVALALSRGDRLRYANLAIRGRLLAQVVDEQLPVAEDLAPDLVSFHAGANDVLRPRTDMAALHRGYTAAVRRLQATGGRLVLFTVIGRAGRRRGRLVDAIAARFAAFNDNVRRTADEVGAHLVDLGAVEALSDPRLWHEDRLHLAPAGHARVAAGTLEALGVDDPDLLGGDPGWWCRPLVAPGPRARGVEVAEDLRWVGRHLLPWVGRRLRGVSSGDAIAPKRPAPDVLEGVVADDVDGITNAGS